MCSIQADTPILPFCPFLLTLNLFSSINISPEALMSKIAIVTDSTASVTDPFLKRYPIFVAPQVLVWGNETFEDGVDIQPSEFYARLKTSKSMPTTSQVTPGSFQKVFSTLLEQEYEILAILISEKLSGTVASAVQAKELFPGAPIELVDSNTTSLAMGFQIFTVAEAIGRGATLAECKELAEYARSFVGVCFAVDTLEFLYRGGRIGGGSRFLGTALNIKPILEVVGGRVEAVERVRTRKKSLERMVELVEQRIAGRKPVRLGALYTNMPQEAKDLLAEASARIECVQSLIAEVSPVIGTHAGPGTVGLAFMAGL
jgi:DegV family protein with EDD domain